MHSRGCDAKLWSGCISGAWQEDPFLKAFREMEFIEVNFADSTEAPWEY